WQKISARRLAQAAAPSGTEAITSQAEPLGGNNQASLPAFNQAGWIQAITRQINPYTDFPERPPIEVQNYTVSTGDSVFEIATNFSIEPETVLWANYDVLNDNPDLLSIGME